MHVCAARSETWSIRHQKCTYPATSGPMTKSSESFVTWRRCDITRNISTLWNTPRCPWLALSIFTIGPSYTNLIGNRPPKNDLFFLLSTYETDSKSPRKPANPIAVLLPKQSMDRLKPLINLKERFFHIVTFALFRRPFKSIPFQETNSQAKALTRSKMGPAKEFSPKIPYNHQKHQIAYRLSRIPIK